MSALFLVIIFSGIFFLGAAIIYKILDYFPNQVAALLKWIGDVED